MRTRHSVLRNVLWLLACVVVIPTVSVSGQTVSYTDGTLTENFDTMGPAGTNTPLGWFVGWAGGTVAFATNIAIKDGSVAPNQNAGWNFGASGASDRALGTMATSSGTPTPPGNDRFIEVRIQNNSGQPIAAVHVRYDGEQWRTGSSSTQVNTNILQFSSDGLNFVNMGTNFQFVQPVFSPTSTAIDGNAAANRRTNIGGVYFLPSTVPAGGVIYLRWYDPNDPSTDPALAMDNFSFSGTNVLIAITNQPQTQAVIPGANLSFSVTAGPNILTYQWQKDGVNLTDGARITGVNTATLTIATAQPADLGKYSVVVSNADASLHSDSATLVFVPPAVHWARQAGASGSTADFGDGISCDGASAVYVTGQYFSGANFSGTVLTGSGCFLARYTVAGVLEWVRTATSASAPPTGHSVSADPLGNCYVTGSFDGTATFGATNLTSAGGSDVFVAKYDSAGNLLWVTQQGGTFDDSGRGVVSDGTNGCIMTGLRQSSGSSASRDILVARYSANGSVQWQRQPASSSSDAGMAVAADSQGNGFVTGWFTGTANFSTTNVTAIGNRDIFVAKYSTNGTLLWVATTGGAGGDEGKGVGVDMNGDVYVTGSFDIGGGSTSNDAEKLLLTKFSSSGGLLWQRELLASFWYFDFSSASDRQGNTWVVGGIRGNGSVEGLPVTSTGSYDGVIAKYNSEGTLVWLSQLSGAGSAIIHRVASDGFGRCYVTGEFDGAVGLTSTNLTSSGGSDILIARIGNEIPEPLGLAIRRSNGVALNIRGTPGALVELQSASAVTNASWFGITNFILSTNEATFLDSTNQPQRFYRALGRP